MHVCSIAFAYMFACLLCICLQNRHYNYFKQKSSKEIKFSLFLNRISTSFEKCLFCLVRLNAFSSQQYLEATPSDGKKFTSYIEFRVFSCFLKSFLSQTKYDTYKTSLSFSRKITPTDSTIIFSFFHFHKSTRKWKLKFLSLDTINEKQAKKTMTTSTFLLLT